MPEINIHDWTKGRIPGELRHWTGLLVHVSFRQVYHDRIIPSGDMLQLLKDAESQAEKYNWLGGGQPIWLR